MGLDGVVLIDKPADLTSRTVVDKVMRTFGAKKAGHFGTLDPFATGLLCVGLGQGTKLLPFMSAGDKEYIAVIGFEKFTDTDDLKGEAIARFDKVRVDLKDVQAWLAENRGWINQVPPEYCAQKHGGKPLYKLKRQNIEVSPRVKQVYIAETEVMECGDDWLKLRVVCSRGTYIRSIARDMGKALGVGGYLRELRRLKSEGFSIEQAHSLDDVIALADKGSIEVLPLAAALSLPTFRVNAAGVLGLQEGRALQQAWLLDEVDLPEQEFIGVTSAAGQLVSIVRVKREGGIVGSIERGFHP